MKNLIFINFYLLTGFSCNKEEIILIQQVQISQTQTTSKKDLLCKTWRLVQEISGSDVKPYGPFTYDYSISCLKPRELREYHKDSTYVVYTPGNCSDINDNTMNVEKGFWAFNQDSTRLGSDIYEYNGKIITKSIMSFYWYIEELTETKLKISFQGRAGNVYLTYIPFNISDKKTDYKK